MKRITEPSTIVDDLMPGTEYVFRVIAGNHIGSSEPSEESTPYQMPRSRLDTEFSLDPFHDHYSLEGEIGRYGNVVRDCLPVEGVAKERCYQMHQNFYILPIQSY